MDRLSTTEFAWRLMHHGRRGGWTCFSVLGTFAYVALIKPKRPLAGFAPNALMNKSSSTSPIYKMETTKSSRLHTDIQCPTLLGNSQKPLGTLTFATRDKTSEIRRDVDARETALIRQEREKKMGDASPNSKLYRQEANRRKIRIKKERDRRVETHALSQP